MVNIKNRNEILSEIIQKGKKHPRNWKAVFGRDNLSLSNDCYLINPRIGIYLLKEYHKNPYEIKGIGGKIARKVDDDIINNQFSKDNADFGIIQGDFQKILKNLEKGVNPRKIFNSAIEGKKDYGLNIPIKGKASSSLKSFNEIRTHLEDRQKSLDSKMKDILSEDGLYSSYD